MVCCGMNCDTEQLLDLCPCDGQTAIWTHEVLYAHADECFALQLIPPYVRTNTDVGQCG